MARYQVILTYDGTCFRGFQRQAKGRTVQEEVEKALRQLGWFGLAVTAAGRTDAGVHASGQVIAFDLVWDHSIPELQRALNSLLPLDVVATHLGPAHPDFHPRYDALSRRYHYRLYSQPVRDPLRERYAWRVWPGVDGELLHQSALMLLGKHDFAAFGTPPRAGGNTVRTVYLAGWNVQDDQWVFEIVADAFLNHMVRRMVAFQVSIAQGRQELDALKRCFGATEDSSGKRILPVQGMAPPHGLELMEVVYPAEMKPGELSLTVGDETNL